MEKMDFPESEELPEGVREIEAEDTFGYCTELYTDVEYAVHSGKKLHLQIMTPTVFGQDLKWPLIVYVQGSSWHKQNLFQSLPTLARMCERGYAIAIVEHRESDLAPFPAQVIDVKIADPPPVFGAVFFLAHPGGPCFLAAGAQDGMPCRFPKGAAQAPGRLHIQFPAVLRKKITGVQNPCRNRHIFGRRLGCQQERNWQQRQKKQTREDHHTFALNLLL